MHVFKHPKYYKELRERNKETQPELQRILDKPGRSVSNSDQAISYDDSTESQGVRPGPGLKPQAPSESSKKPQASSPKQQASRSKPQAASSKILEPR